jgi:phosphatidylserine/phosphatidylglycerophosphate/cardiolipin synthase-like enzyme
MGTFYNGANCDIYIGKGAGKKLLEDISNAKHTVRIVSPYLSPFLIKELICLYKKGININLITTDTIEDFYGAAEKNMHKLILQHQLKDLEAEKIRNNWIDLTKILLSCIIGITLALAWIAYFYQEIKIIYGIIPLVLIYLLRNFYKNKIKNKKIFNYTYSQLFPFKVFVSRENSVANTTFIHGKIYVIDDEIVYMGSLNFTGNGTRGNYETRIRTTDNEAVIKIVNEFNNLFYRAGLPERDIQFWGRELYAEPIN